MRFITFITFFTMTCVCTANTICEPQQACAPVVKACAPVTAMPEDDACDPVATACDPVDTPQVWTVVPYAVQQTYIVPYTVEPTYKIQIQRQLRVPYVPAEKAIIRERTIKVKQRYEMCPPQRIPYDPMLHMRSTQECLSCF